MNRTYLMTEKNMLIVKRSFDAPVSLVWRAWSEAELPDKWWAPKPWTSETVHMEFKEGGYRLYAMVSPEGEKHWSRIDFEYNSEDDLKKIIQMGMKEGLEMACQNLDALLPEITTYPPMP